MDVNFLERIAPELRDVAQMVEAVTGQFSPLTMENLEAWRALMEANRPPAIEGVDVLALTVPAVRDGPEIPVYAVNAQAGAARPGILHIHGGGFAAGSAEGALSHVQALARTLDCTVVSVNYRLAPETPYPGSLEDNYSALCWMHDHAREIGVDSRRLAVMGESAGGGHAVLLCAAARDRGGPSILFQALSYPMLDDRTGSISPMPGHIGVIGWTADANRFGWRSFLGQEPGSEGVSRCAVPARIERLDGLPPAFIGVGALDLFVEEDIDFARRLVLAGVPTELLVVPGAFHGFDTVVPEAAVSRRFAAARTDALRRAFAATG